MPRQPLTYVTAQGVLHIDSNRPQRQAVAAGKIRLCALTHRHYTGHLLVGLFAIVLAAGSARAAVEIRATPGGSAMQQLAVKEVVRYYWIWTPEGWTWGGNRPEQYAATARDVQLASQALRNVGAPFQLATCGWVLGPAHDRAAFDNDLPKDVPMAAISRNTGATEVDPAFGRVAGREKWAIPWLESDNREGLAGVQLFAGRMRRDAADALAYGCTGLMGLQWRTEILGPNVAALAEAAWDQSGWNPSPGKIPAEATAPTDGPLGGAVAENRALPCDEFYADWATANFGQAEIGKVFAAVDGKVPQVTDGGCPSGKLTPVGTPWSAVAPRFAFVDELESFRPRVRGGGNLDRFD